MEFVPVHYDPFADKVDKSKDKFHQLNEEGLDRAYNNKFTYTDIQGDTLFIGGTQNVQDVYDDVRHVPWWGDMKQTQRYKDCELILKKNPQVKHLVSHSLGGSVALALQKNHPDKKYTVVTYGAPVIGMLDPFRGDAKVQRFKHIGRDKEGENIGTDPISSFDMFANEVPINSMNPLTLHSYKGYVYDWDNHRLKPSTSTSKFYTNQTTQQGFPVGEPDIRAGLGAVGREGNTYRIY